MKSLFVPSLFVLSLSYLSISNPSLWKPSVSHLGNGHWAVWWGRQKEWLLTIFFSDFKRAGQKVQGILLFVPLRRFYTVLFIPLFCCQREKCGTLWKKTWLHNVDNIRQKDIKEYLSRATYSLNSYVAVRKIGSLFLRGTKRNYGTFRECPYSL